MTKTQAHEVYDLPNFGVDAQLLIEVDFINKDWLKCFKEVPKWGRKVKCRDVKPELWNIFYVLFTSMYQEPPRNYGMEVTKGFARCFLYEQLKGQVDWALFLESIVTNMDPGKLHAKKQRWPTFHSSSVPNSLQRMTRTPNHLEAPQETPINTVDDVQKKNLFGPLSLTELDTVYNMVVSKHSFALSEYNETFKKLELLQANVHQNEGANLLVENLRGQLKDAEAALLKVEGSVNAVDAMKVEQLKNTISKVSLTLQTLQVVVEEKTPLDAMDSALTERDFT
ncbi:hypothetical protein L7F22_031358 [Adiantum nelumboides]|nr:hypothetical protein [Adiantum nelumboides]